MRWLVVPLLLILIISPMVQGARYMDIVIEGPTIVAAGTNNTYNITLKVFFLEEEPARYGVVAWISGENLSGAEPVSPVSAESNYSSSFTVYFTFPEAPGTVILHVIGYVVGESGEVYEDHEELSIQVVSPIVLKADVRNPNPFPVENVTIVFYVDGVRVGSVRVDRIEAESNETVEYPWAAVALEKGWHTVEVRAEGASFLITAHSYKFYYGVPSTGKIKAFLWALTIGILAVFGYLTLKARRSR